MKQALAAIVALVFANALHAQESPNPSPQEIAQSQIERRAIEAMVWGMPAVNFERMFMAGVETLSARGNQVVYWSALIPWKCQLLTPNQDVIYLLPFIDTREVGPVVVEIPPADEGVIVGTLMDAWQMPLVDVGLTGTDRGAGAKYLILPPGHAGAVPEGYIALPCHTHMAYGLIRALMEDNSPASIAKAAAYGRRMKIYPLSQAASPPDTVYHDAMEVLYDATIPYDASFFAHLNRFVQREPWIQRDRAMIDTLRTLGIERGKPYAPDAKMTSALDAAAREGFKILDAGFEAIFETPFAPGSRWAFLASQEFATAAMSGYADPEIYPLDDRGVLFTFIFFTPKTLGDRQFWLKTHQDSDGAHLAGDGSYRLTVPAKVPVNQYWSVTAYDRVTHALIRNMPVASRSSLTQGLRTNDDGTVDIYFGPQPPEGQPSNWIPTDPKGRFELIFRFYGPQPAIFDKSWVLPDIEKVK